MRYGLEKSDLPSLAVSKSLTPPSSSPIATREFAVEVNQGFIGENKGERTVTASSAKWNSFVLGARDVIADMSVFRCSRKI